MAQIILGEKILVVVNHDGIISTQEGECTFVPEGVAEEYEGPFNIGLKTEIEGEMKEFENCACFSSELEARCFNGDGSPKAVLNKK